MCNNCIEPNKEEENTKLKCNALNGELCVCQRYCLEVKKYIPHKQENCKLYK